MNEKLSKRDWETVSAYLDGQISGRNLARFEARLSRNPRLRAALEEMSATRQVLRSAPRLRAPRNFTLTPEMVGLPRRKPRFAPFFGWATAAVSLLLLAVLAGDFFATNGMKTSAAMEAASEPVAQEVALDVALEEEAAAPVEAEPENFDAPAAGGYSEVQPGTSEETVSPEVAAAPDVEPTIVSEQIFSPAVTPTIPPEISPTPTDETLFAAAETVTETMLQPAADVPITTTEVTAEIATEAPTPERADSGTENISPEPPIEETPAGKMVQPTAEAPPLPTLPPPATLAEMPAPEIAAMEEPSVPAETGEQAEPERRSAQEQPAAIAEEPTFNLLRGVEVILLLLAAGTGIAWVYLRRQGA